MKGTEHRDPDRGQDTLEDLFRHASAREKPPLADEQRIRAALHDEWRDMTKRRKRRRAVVSLAAVASVMLAVMLVITQPWNAGLQPPARQVASLVRISGAVYWKQGAEPVKRLEATAQISTGQSVTTRGGGRLALAWLDGTSVRVDQNSSISVTAEGDINLLAGRLYLDTQNSDAPAGAPAILTPVGRIRHLGTQYMASVAGGITTVSVREGQVELESGDIGMRAVAGERLEVDVSGAARIRPVAIYGDQWQWAGELTPVWSSNGRSVTEFLAWVSRETGHSVQFDSPAAEQQAGATSLHGDVEMAPLRALEVMLQTSNLKSEIDQGIISVRLDTGF